MTNPSQATLKLSSKLGLGLAVLLLAACASKRPTLYEWDQFAKQQYDSLLAPGSSQLQDLEKMKQHAVRTQSSGKALPPGFRAHMGLLLLNAGDATGAQSQFEAERQVFPESAPYIERLFKNATPSDSGEKKQ